MSKLTITPIGNAGQARIELDGTDISNGVRAIDLKLAVGEVAQVTLDMAVFVEPVELGDPKIYLPEQTMQALEALGWVPPDKLADAIKDNPEVLRRFLDQEARARQPWFMRFIDREQRMAGGRRWDGVR